MNDEEEAERFNKTGFAPDFGIACRCGFIYPTLAAAVDHQQECGQGDDPAYNTREPVKHPAYTLEGED